MHWPPTSLHDIVSGTSEAKRPTVPGVWLEAPTWALGPHELPITARTTLRPPALHGSLRSTQLGAAGAGANRGRRPRSAAIGRICIAAATAAAAVAGGRRASYQPRPTRRILEALAGGIRESRPLLVCTNIKQISSACLPQRTCFLPCAR